MAKEHDFNEHESQGAMSVDPSKYESLAHTQDESTNFESPSSTSTPMSAETKPHIQQLKISQPDFERKEDSTTDQSTLHGNSPTKKKKKNKNKNKSHNNSRLNESKDDNLLPPSERASKIPSFPGKSSGSDTTGQRKSDQGTNAPSKIPSFSNKSSSSDTSEKRKSDRETKRPTKYGKGIGSKWVKF